MEELSKDSIAIDRFNVRVYGIAINKNKEVLLCREHYKGMVFTKFPGGGLEFGEGIIPCLQREFKEELNVEIDTIRHFYTTDYFQQSAFVKTDQLISIYYLVEMKNEPANYKITYDQTEIEFFWKPLKDLTENDVTFPIDKIVLMKLMG